MRISDWSSDVCSSDLRQPWRSVECHGGLCRGDRAVFRVGLIHRADRPAVRGGEGDLHVERCGGASVGVGLLNRLWPDVFPRRGADRALSFGAFDPDRAFDDGGWLPRDARGRKPRRLSARARRPVHSRERHHHIAGRGQPARGGARRSETQPFPPDLQPDLQQLRHLPRPAHRRAPVPGGRRGQGRHGGDRGGARAGARRNRRRLFLDLRADYRAALLLLVQPADRQRSGAARADRRARRNGRVDPRGLFIALGAVRRARDLPLCRRRSRDRDADGAVPNSDAIWGQSDAPFGTFGWIMGNDGVPGVSLQEAGKAVALYWGGAMVGRAIGSVLLARFSASKLLVLFTAIAALLCLYVLFVVGVSAGFVALSISVGSAEGRVG